MTQLRELAPPTEEDLHARPAWAEIDLDALAANYRTLAARLGPETKIIASVKANAYGHGVVPVSRRLTDEGIFALATGSLRDAISIRRAGIETKIITLGGYEPTATRVVLAENLTPTVFNLEGARAVSDAASGPTGVYVKVDTGLGRLGVPAGEALAFVRAISELPNVHPEGLYTHLPFADEQGRRWAEGQLGVFQELVDALGDSGLPVEVTQALSSSGALAGLADPGNAVCAGHILYGVLPLELGSASAEGFQPVYRAIRSRLIHVAHHNISRTAGIGGGIRLPAGSITGVLPLGRYDGYRSARRGRASVLIEGRRAPVLFVSLEHTTLDLTGIDGVQAGAVATLLGGHGDDRIALEELAAWQGTVASEVLMNFDGRLPCHYLGADS